MNIIEWLESRHIKVNNTKMVQQAFIHSSYAHEHKSK
ncbi:MAG: ribonuclease III, partial [Solobacterium sp.]|nr:ribonuclease III [Solobacterium sp.]